MKIAVGCDPNATEFKKILIPYIESLGQRAKAAKAAIAGLEHGNGR